MLNKKDQGITSSLAETYGFFFNMEANGDLLSQSHDSGGQDIQADGEEAKITYLVVDN